MEHQGVLVWDAAIEQPDNGMDFDLVDGAEGFPEALHRMFCNT